MKPKRCFAHKGCFLLKFLSSIFTIFTSLNPGHFVKTLIAIGAQFEFKKQ